MSLGQQRSNVVDGDSSGISEGEDGKKTDVKAVVRNP